MFYRLPLADCAFRLDAATACTSIFIPPCNNATASAPNTAAAPAGDRSAKIDYAICRRIIRRNIGMVAIRKSCHSIKYVKAFENENIDEAISPFADGIAVAMDGLDTKC